jgi:O-antigen/teichoic acid export membrane protein
MTPWTRIRTTLFANSFGQGVSLVGQLLLVPLFISHWGVGLYGEWLILTAIPAYFAFADLGVTSAAGNQIAEQSAAGRRDEVISTYHCLFVIVAFASAISLIAGGVIVALQSVLEKFGISQIQKAHAAGVIALLTAYLIMGFIMSAANAALRCGDNYPFAAAFSNILRFFEMLATAMLIILGGDPLQLAALMLTLRVCATLFIFQEVRRRLPWLRPGFQGFQMQRLQLLVRPSLGFLAFQFGNALNFQGILIVIGAAANPVVAVTFATFRTVANSLLQVGSVISSSTLPEISSAWGRGDLNLCRNILVKAIRYSVAITMVLGLFALLTGHWIIPLWTRSQVPYEATVFGLIVFSGIINSLWLVMSTTVAATNRHANLAFSYVFLSILFVGGAYLSILHFGLVGVGVGLVLLNVIMCFLTIQYASFLLGGHGIGMIKKLIGL